MSDRLIYALVDPRTGEFRYVGLSTRGMKRPETHLRPVLKSDKTYRANWLRGLHAEGLQPQIEILESGFEDDTALGIAEDKWIRLFRSTGSRLTNLRAGGNNGQLSVETRTKIGNALRGLKRSEEMKIKLSLAKQGSKNPMFGKKQTPEHVEKRVRRGAANNMFGKQPAPGTEATRFQPGHGAGIPKTPEQIAKLSGANHWTKRDPNYSMPAETRRKISEAGKGRVPPNKGVPHSAETRAKIKAAVSGKSHTPGCSVCKQPGHYKTTCPDVASV